MTQTKDETERMIAAVIEATPIPLTAGSVLRVMETNGANPPSRTTVQRILDRMFADGAIETVTRDVEINGHIKPARHYTKKAKRCECNAAGYPHAPHRERR